MTLTLPYCSQFEKLHFSGAIHESKDLCIDKTNMEKPGDRKDRSLDNNMNGFENGEGSTNSISNLRELPLNLSNSNLTPTAKEFMPGSSRVRNVEDGISNMYGATKKNQFKNARHNENRNNTVSTSSNNFYRRDFPRNNYRKNNTTRNFSRKIDTYASSKSEEHNDSLEDTTEFSQGIDIPSKFQASSKKNYDERSNSSYNRRSKEYFSKNFGSNKGHFEGHMGRNFQRDRENWRAISFQNQNVTKISSESFEKKESSFDLKKKLNVASQREKLEQLIIRRLLECLVCCEKIKHVDAVWSCKQCYHILHLNCVERWAQTSKLDSGWRCPACQNVCPEVPKEYFCFCGKIKNPQPDVGVVVHSCGEVCQRKSRTCVHLCTLLCHPGPCPDCNAIVARSCGCGATKPFVKCCSESGVECHGPCNKLLLCSVHRCSKTCHGDTCDLCTEVIRQECFCGKVGRRIPCTLENQGIYNYTCGEPCGKILSCGNHKCKNICHSGACPPCSQDTDQITTCPCGQMSLMKPRASCLDPIPCCENICTKALKCGQPSVPHRCKALCHAEPCPPCILTTLVRCRCGHMDREIPCTKLTTKADDARCEKKCVKRRLCGKHKCNQLCCIEIEHICPLPCNRTLSCGLHRCEDGCHKGRCRPCWRTSFTELYCECGASVLYPPVACGTRPPICSQACSRARDCEHEPLHSCHSGPCPPCTVLTKRWCYGHHEQRSTIPCHQKDFSCGRPCGKDLSCGRHKCIQSCHSGPCPFPCKQRCTEGRVNCGHTCNQPCHELPCPETACKHTVRVTCECGLRSSSRVCMELAGEYHSITMSQLATKMAELQQGHSVDISNFTGSQRKLATLKTLECNDECRLVERNRRLAIGLQIRNPDLSAKLTPRYSDYMRLWAKKDSRFCQHVHEKLTELVQLAKQSKQKSRSFSFERMNRDKRHFVHEYSEHFGCETAAYDQEPNRNVVATAFRDKSWLPSISLLQLLQRENGQRKVPGPVITKNDASKSAPVSVRLNPTTVPGECIDYFNNP